MLQLHSCPVQALDATIYQQLLRLNHGHAGCMLSRLESIHQGDEAWFITEQGYVIAWALVHQRFSHHTTKTVHLWTSKLHRGRGMATMLMKHILKKYHTVQGSHRSSPIFGKFNCLDSHE